MSYLFSAEFWFIVTGVLLAVEIFATGLAFPIILACASLGTGITVLFTHNLFIIFAVFIVISILGIFYIKPLLEKYFKTNQDTRSSNIDALIGKKGVIVKPIQFNKKGYVKIEGEEWAAVCVNNSVISIGSNIVVKEIKGVTLFVEEVDNGGEY